MNDRTTDPTRDGGDTAGHGGGHDTATPPTIRDPEARRPRPDRILPERVGRAAIEEGSRSADPTAGPARPHHEPGRARGSERSRDGAEVGFGRTSGTHDHGDRRDKRRKNRQAPRGVRAGARGRDTDPAGSRGDASERAGRANGSAGSFGHAQGQGHGQGHGQGQGQGHRPPAARRGADRTPPSSTQARPHHRGRHLPVYGALDLGTNNCRLLIATPTRSQRFRVVDAFSRIVRLGEGLGHTNWLDEGAMDRAIGALKQCASKLNGRPIRRRRLIATEACRRAANGADFIARVRAETGLALEIVDRKTEAHLAVAGCASLIDRNARGVVLFDIGGGSTEIALIDLTSPENRPAARSISAWTSLPVGVVTLSEKFGGREVTPAVFAEMTEHVLSLLEDFGERRQLRRIAGSRRFHLLGTSGTVTTLAGLHLKLERYDRKRVDGLWMRADDLSRVQNELLHSSYEQRRASPCIGNDRADLVLAGCAILEAIRRTWPSERLRVADRGLREGMLSDMMVSDDAWNRAAGRH